MVSLPVTSGKQGVKYRLVERCPGEHREGASSVLFGRLVRSEIGLDVDGILVRNQNNVSFPLLSFLNYF